MTRFFINKKITAKAEEDLMRLFLAENLEPSDFYYSPFILRLVVEQLIKKGQSIGLGYVSSKDILDRYWDSVSLNLSTAIVIRIIKGVGAGKENAIILLLNDEETSIKVFEEFVGQTKLRARNKRVLHYSSTLPLEGLQDIYENILKIIDKHSITYKIEKYTLKEKIVEVDGFVYYWVVPDNLGFSCNRCNMCELPSHFSVNPIPNNSDHPILHMATFENRIAFSSNLAVLSANELEKITKNTHEKKEEIARPILGFTKNHEDFYEVVYALKQEQGKCIFQDLEEKKCLIHDFKPLNCKSYPLLINDLGDKEYELELDFTCPGISNTDPLVDIKELTTRFHCVLKKEKERQDKKSCISISKFPIEWKKYPIWIDKERVIKKDLIIAKKYIEEYRDNVN